MQASPHSSGPAPRQELHIPLVRSASDILRATGHGPSQVAMRGFAVAPAALPGSLGGGSEGLPEQQHSPDPGSSLCRLMQHCTQMDLHREPGEQLAEFLRSSFSLDAVAIFDADLNSTYRAGQWFADPENTLRNIHLFERSAADPETGLTSEVLRICRLSIGALLLRGEIGRELAGAIASLVAATFDRYHSRANLTRVESAREAERLRSTVLDSLAHAYKTPLTAIQAAATGLHEIGLPSPAQTELVTLIEEQTTALSDLTVRLLATARLEAHDISLHTARVALEPLVEDVLAAVRVHSPEILFRVSIPADLSLVCDRELLATLLTQYLDNAAKYSEMGSPVSVEVAQQGESVLFSVHNFGPAIPVSEYERIFDRYTRSPATASGVPGTGIGLSIARAAAQAHGGDVWVNSHPVDGTTFWASLPVRPRGERTP